MSEFFRETSDPVLHESAARAQAALLDYRQLYELWKRQQWKTQDRDFSRDREDWESFGEEDRFLRDMVVENPEYSKTIQRTLEEALPVTDAVLSPPWVEDTSDYELFGINVNETRAFAAQALRRRPKVIGLARAV